MRSQLFCLLAFLALSTAQQQLQQTQQRPNYTHHAVLDPNGKFLVHWRPGTNDTDFITFECEVATQGWIGLGFSSNGAMTGADIVIAWIDQSGKPQISDRHGPTQGNGFPPADSSQNYELLSGRKNRTHTVITFRRRHDTCDHQDWKITSDTTRLIWAYNDQVPTSAENIPIHTQRGVQSAQLVNPQTKDGMSKIVADPSTKTFDLRLTNVKLPADKRTLYWCEIIELPKWKRHHIIANRMMIQKGNEKYVHHLVLYSCGDTDMSQYLGKPAACFDDTLNFNPMKQCSDYLAVWAVGGEDFVYPSNMGAPFFEDKQRFVLLEMHYDNADLTPGITDSSAFRLYMTEKPRPVETGRFTVGVPVMPAVHVIPPKQQKFTTYAYCPSECTSKMTQPMNIFTGLLHTHLLGVALRLRVIRKGVELKSDMKDDHYDFNYQSPVFLTKPIQLLPGDDLIVECTYDSTARDKTTYGGFGTDNEMCLAFLEYYPKRNKTTEGCMSFVDQTEVLQILGLKKDQFDLGPSGGFEINSMSVINQNKQNVSLINWYKNDLKYTDAMVSKLQDFMKNSPQTVSCGLEGQKVNSEGQRGTETNAAVIKLNGSVPITRPYVEPKAVCVVSGNNAGGMTQANGNQGATSTSNNNNNMRQNQSNQPNQQNQPNQNNGNRG
uniref:DOMON domain-containing protein n=1 Tax=Plectus sambesii TaxID=2011161 RepID=A0A914W9W3_9BILA